MPGTTPEVDTVMWRAPSPNRRRSFSASIAASTLSRLRSGSPIPMNTMFVSRWPVRGQPPRRVAGLVDDLGRVEVAREAELARGAERATDRAAGLARQAERVPLAGSGAGRVVHQHGFDQRAVGKPVERLLGQPGVPEDQLGRLDRVEAEGRIQRVPERCRQGRDRCRSSGMAAPQSVRDLAGAIRPLAMLDEPCLEILGPDTGQPGARISFHHARC